ncbi:MAG: hypothetical protein E3J67_02970, partial [Dehalococcoidia bacterium]
MAKVKFALGLLLLLGLMDSTTTFANPALVEWSEVKSPTDGKAGDWVLALGSDVQQLTMAIDGTLYAYKFDGTTHHLMKSTDGGCTWEQTDYDGGAIADIACSRIDAETIYLTDGRHVYKSDDGGDSFDKVGYGTFPALDASESVACLDVGYNGNDDPFVFIGTADKDKDNFGGVYCIAEADFGARWADVKVGNYDLYSIAGSPDFAQDSRVMALVTDETHTYIINNYGVLGDWSHPVELVENNASSFAVSAASRICFPSDFDQIYEFFVGVAVAGNGDVYRVTEKDAYDLGVDADIISLDLVGEIGDTRLLAGGTAGKVWYSTDDGESWYWSKKAPSGDGLTYVVMAADFADSSIAYAATSGTESAFSISRDGGVTWNQTSLIDTKISDIVDLAPSPSYSQDNTLFMLTEHTDGEHSLWRSLNGGTSWERVYTSALSDVEQIDRVALSPQYDSDNQVVFIAGRSNGSSAIWKSDDNGQNFKRRIAPFPIDAWAVVDDTSLFIGSFDEAGNLGLAYRTTNSGRSYSEGTVAGSQSLKSIALSPDYDEDETVLVGNKDGWVYWSEDNGASFEPLPPDATSKPLTGSVTIAFDPGYSSNKTVYAASDTAGEGIYRFIIGKSDAWESIDSPDEGMIGQMIVSAEGTLYATNFKADGGMERCLNPTYSLGPTFETVTKGLDDGVTLIGLWLDDNRLWSIDTTNVKLMTYTDSLTQPVALTAPLSEAPGVGTIIDSTVRKISLDWKTSKGATEYKWQLDYDTDFSSVPSDFEGDTKTSSARLPALEPATTYYWRVRATEPVLSPWSAKWSFTTSLGTEVSAPKLDSPKAGASGMPVKPIFQWSAVAGADSYELVVSTEANLDNPTILKTGAYALPTTAWQCNIALNYNTAYYWKVRAISSDTCSAWSAVSAFTIEPPPSPQLTPPPEPPQPPKPIEIYDNHCWASAGGIYSQGNPHSDPNTDPNKPNCIIQNCLIA